MLECDPLPGSQAAATTLTLNAEFPKDCSRSPAQKLTFTISETPEHTGNAVRFAIAGFAGAGSYEIEEVDGNQDKISFEGTMPGAGLHATSLTAPNCNPACTVVVENVDDRAAPLQSFKFTTTCDKLCGANNVYNCHMPGNAPITFWQIADCRGM